MLNTILHFIGFHNYRECNNFSSSLTDEEVTKLWLMRLGHMSKNGITESYKSGILDGQKASNMKFGEQLCLWNVENS